MKLSYAPAHSGKAPALREALPPNRIDLIHENDARLVLLPAQFWLLTHIKSCVDETERTHPRLGIPEHLPDNTGALADVLVNNRRGDHLFTPLLLGRSKTWNQALFPANAEATSQCQLALMKFAVMLCAIARAKSVFPVPLEVLGSTRLATLLSSPQTHSSPSVISQSRPWPGGPYKSTPLGVLIPGQTKTKCRRARRSRSA